MTPFEYMLSPNQRCNGSKDLLRRIMRAADQVHQLEPATPLERLTLPGHPSVLVKREDCSRIHSHKWRGAFNKLCALRDQDPNCVVVAASMGNHAHGIAASAAHLHMNAVVFLPEQITQSKVDGICRLGGDWVTVHIAGRDYDEAHQHAKDYVRSRHAVLVSAFDDLDVIAGQGTIGLEMLAAGARPDTVFLQIGGGGFAAGIACVLRAHLPDVRIIGVEAEDQATMDASMRLGRPVSIDHVGSFCDGTAVRESGRLTVPLCAELIDDMMTVTNTDIRDTIRTLWEHCRIIPEPAGALGLAGFLNHHDEQARSNAAVVISGANMDCSTLASMMEAAPRRSIVAPPGRGRVS